MTPNREKGIRGVIALLLIVFVVFIMSDVPYAIFWDSVFAVILAVSGYSVFNIPKLWEKSEDD